MRCPACGVMIHDADEFCRRCGARVVAGSESPVEVVPPPFGPRGGDEPEETLWEGTYAVKAMFRELAMALGASAAVWVITHASADEAVRFWAWPAVGTVMGLFVLLVIFRKLDVWYCISNQRLFHEDGILYRRLNRIEIIDVDDLRCEQGLIERLLGVGRIIVRSSDESHPLLVMEGIDRVRDVYEIIDRARRRERTRHGLHVEAL